MDPLTIAALVQAGTSIVGGLFQSNAASKAAKQQQGAEQTALQAKQKALAEAQRIQAPYVAGGYAGHNALTHRFGLPSEAIDKASTMTQPRGTPSPADILKNRPDVMAEYQRLSPNNMKNNLGIDPTPEAFASWWWGQSGQFEDNPWANPAPAEGGSGTSGSPAPGNALAGGNVFGNTTNPTYAAPSHYERPRYTAPTPPPSARSFAYEGQRGGFPPPNALAPKGRFVEPANMRSF